MPKNKFEKALEKIEQAKNILLVIHERPDSDALASVCAIMDFLISLKKNFLAYCYHSPGPQFKYLVHLEKIISEKNFDFSDFDLIITIDCGSITRTKLENEINNKKERQFIIEFDHHQKTSDYSNLEIRNPEAVSTTEILYDFFKINKIKINKNIATCILTGILTDTANFLYPATTEKSIKISSEMLALGAQLPVIMENNYRNKSLAAMKVWGSAINNLEINQKYNIACSVLTEKELIESGITEEELDGISGFLSNLYGVNAIMLLREEKNKIKGSLRAQHPDVDVSRLARILGGGGHTKSAGFEIKSDLQKTEKGWQII